jgi:uncharacterized protein (DUF362 family)
MKSRREFLKEAAAGAVVVGSARAADGLALASALDQRAQTAKSKVVIAREPALGSGRLEEKRVLELLDRAMAAYTSRDHPVEAWKRVVPPGVVVGLKVNGLGGRGISTHSVLVQAVTERLQQAGVPAGNIVVWDRNARDLEACGLTINTNAGKVRCFGSDISGFDNREEICGPARVRFSNILTRECGFVISMPILKDHSVSGMTFSMKNMFGVIDRPFLLHANCCNPGIADLNAIPVIRDKVRFTIGDALTSVYEGGPEFRPEHLWRPNALVVGEDRVAVDTVAWQMLERQRAAVGLPSLAADGRSPSYIATAADAKHRLGVHESNRIQLLEI